MARLGKQLARVDRRITRAVRREGRAEGSADLLGALAPELRQQAADRAATLRERATNVDSVKRAMQLNRKAGRIEAGVEAESFRGSPRVEALRALARATRAPAIEERRTGRVEAANARRGELIRDTVRGAQSNRSATGLGLNLAPAQRAALRVAGNSGTIQSFLDTLRGRQARRFDALTRMEGTRGTIARGFLAADENARRQATETALSDPFGDAFLPETVPQRSTPFPAVPQR